MAWMSKTSMPEVRGGGGDVCFCDSGTPEVVERARTVTSENHGPVGKGLHRKTIWIKLNGEMIINSELSNKYEVFDNVWN